VHRLIFAIVISTSLATNVSLWSQSPTIPETTKKASKASQFDSIYQELSDMVPGGVAAGSQVEKSLKETIALFADRKPLEAQEALKKLAAADANIPPSKLMLAAMAFAVNDNVAGRRLLEQAAIDEENYPDGYFSFGQMAMSQQRFTDAEAQAELALQKIQNGEFSQVQITYFKQRYFQIKFQTAKARGQLEAAKGFMQQLEAIAPDAPQTLVGKAELAFEDKDIEKTLGYLQKLDSSTKTKQRAPELTIAAWFQRKGKVENADLWIKKAAAQNSGDADVQLTAARWSLAREGFPNTLQAVKAMEAINGETKISKDLRGKVAFAQGAYSTAEEKYQSLLVEEPGNIDYANMLALSMVQNTDEEKQGKALALAKKVATAQPSNPVALSSLAYVMLKTGQTDGARSIMGKVAQTPSANAEVRFIMAYMLSETGQAPQAKILLDKVLQTKGLFLFRSEALKLLKSVQQSSQGLPAPGK